MRLCNEPFCTAACLGKESPWAYPSRKCIRVRVSGTRSMLYDIVTKLSLVPNQRRSCFLHAGDTLHDTVPHDVFVPGRMIPQFPRSHTGQAMQTNAQATKGQGIDPVAIRGPVLVGE